MKVIYHSEYLNKNLSNGETLYVLPSSSSYLEVQPDKNENGNVLVNGEIIQASDIGKISCFEDTKLTVKTDNYSNNYIVANASPVLKGKLAEPYDCFLYSYDNSYGTDLEKVLSGGVELYSVEQSTEIADIRPILTKIKNTVSAFKKVCDRPKSHLKSINEVRPIDTVKRVGYESIPYLASHSEDWLARTAGGLKPARLFSRTEEEDYHIYENRFVKGVIDDIYKDLRAQKRDTLNKKDQLQGILNCNAESFGFDASFNKCISELISQRQHDTSQMQKNFKLAEELLKILTKLCREFRQLRQSKLYRNLKKAKPVSAPVSETNILLLEKNYNKIFDLWKEWLKFKAPKKVDKPEIINSQNTFNAYITYCRILIGYAAHSLGFECIENGYYERSLDNTAVKIYENGGIVYFETFSSEKRQLKLNKGLSCPNFDAKEFPEFKIIENVLYWDNDTSDRKIDEFCSLFKKNGGTGKEQSENKEKYRKLRLAIGESQTLYGAAKKYTAAIIPEFCQIEDGNRNNLESTAEYAARALLQKYSKLDYVIIAMPVCREVEQKLTRYAYNSGEKVLFLPITMFDINSYRRLQNILLRQLTKLKSDSCPFCGNSLRGNGSRKYCDACGLIITSTKCKNKNCGHEYKYLSYEVKSSEIDEMKNVDKNNFYAIDGLYKYKNIVHMTVDKTLLPVCPNCQSGAYDEKANL